LCGIVAVARHDESRVATVGGAHVAAAPGWIAGGHVPQSDATTTTADPSGTDAAPEAGAASNGASGSAPSGGPGTTAGPGATLPGETTTAPGPPTTVPQSGSPGMVGYVGCSQTDGAVIGYEADGGTHMWPEPELPYGGGTVQAWAKEIAGPGEPLHGHWAQFEGQQQKRPASVVWWQLCTRKDDDQATNTTDAARVRDEIVRLSPPGTVIEVSAQNAYVAPHVCGITGSDGPSRMQTLADQLVAQGLAQQGPNVGALHSKYGAPSQPPGDETIDDGCHPNDAGERNVLGPPLLAFFG
jgi:hypothetical protein